VLLNLMMNAMDAMAGTNDRRKELLLRSRRESANEILVQIEDCGIGLSPDTAGRIFEPFFTTKPQGIGMGLSISRSIIESHKGRLWATPRPAGGAIFQFAIPVHSQDTDADAD
jgi:signal transduction histidine kinase